MSQTIKVLDHGYVSLVDAMGSDTAIVQAARVSYQKGTKSKRSDAGLIDYLVRHDHTSPLEQVVFSFEVKVPLFIARQWLRHRTLSANEVSARYSEVEDEFYIPTEWREQDTVNKQGSVNADLQAGLLHFGSSQITEQRSNDAYGAYQQLLEHGVAREMARMVLPQNVYTSFVFTQNLHNLLHFLRLRLHPHAQAEMRLYAEAILELITPIVPITVKAWEEHTRSAVKFSATEFQALYSALSLRPELFDKLRLIAKDRGLSESRVREFMQKFGESE